MRALVWIAVFVRHGRVGVLCEFHPAETQSAMYEWHRSVVEHGVVGTHMLYDADKVVEMFHFKANRGCPHSQYHLATILHHGLGGSPPDTQAAYMWYCAAAEQGLAKAWFQRGFLVATGEVGKVEYNLETERSQRFMRAFAYFQKAAELGHSAAQIYIKALRSNSLRVPKDNIQAYSWYHAFAEQGDAEAQFLLGRLFCAAAINPPLPYDFIPAAPRDSYIRVLDGARDEGYRLGVPRDEAERAAAVGWLYKAATSGHAKAQMRLGDIYPFRGDDCAAFLEWWRAAAKQGHVKAQIRLAHWHARQGNPEDDLRALELYLRAAWGVGRRCIFLGAFIAKAPLWHGTNKRHRDGS